MSIETDSSQNCLEVIKPFVDKIQGGGDVQVMGGVGTAALVHPRVEIYPNTREVVVPEAFFLPVRREDNTVRDVDVLVLSSNQDRVKEVEELLDETVGSQLEQSVFGIRPHEALRKQLAHPLGFRAFRTFLADRYEGSSDHNGTYVKSLFPFVVPINPETLETWNLIVGDEPTPIPIPHPGTTLINYSNRSISGLRPRDAQKIAFVAENVFTVAPEIKEWMIDGPGASQIELGRLIASLRYRKPTNISLIDGLRVTTEARRDLVDHAAFVVPELTAFEKRAVVGGAVIKASALRAFEENPRIVTLWRHVAEKRADAIVKNA